MEINKEKIFYEFGSKDEVSLRIKFKAFNYSSFKNINLANDREGREII